MPFALIPFLLLAIPILEIAVFIVVGQLIGLWPTLGLVLLTAIFGTLLLKRQGFSTLAAIQRETRAGRVPGRELMDGVMIAVAGVLLLTPGLVTDAIGFLLFVPGARAAIRNWLKSRVMVVGGQSFGMGGGAPTSRKPAGPPTGPADRHVPRDGPDVVDLSGEEFQRQPDPSSPWNGSSAARPSTGPGAGTDDDTPPNGRRLH